MDKSTKKYKQTPSGIFGAHDEQIKGEFLHLVVDREKKPDKYRDTIVVFFDKEEAAGIISEINHQVENCGYVCLPLNTGRGFPGP